jgi:hypothetical protein
MRPDAADLGRDEAGVFERVLGDVEFQLFLSEFRERLVGFQLWIAGVSEAGEDLLQP